MATISNTRAADVIAKLQPFESHTGSLRGQTYYSGNGMYRDHVPTDAEYYVYSYATPIAWVKDGVATIPDTKYSVTTSRHQGIARVGLREYRASTLIWRMRG